MKDRFFHELIHVLHRPFLMPSGKDRNISFINRRLSVAFITWASESKENLGLAFVVSFDFQVCKQCDLEVHFIK